MSYFLILCIQDNADRQTTPRMPWHDLGICALGQAARDASRYTDR